MTQLEGTAWLPPLPPCLRGHMLHCASLASPDNRRNVCIHSCEKAFLHARLLDVLPFSHFIWCFNLWLHYCAWVLFISQHILSLQRCRCDNTFLCVRACVNYVLPKMWQMLLHMRLPKCPLYVLTQISVLFHTFMRYKAIFDPAPFWKCKLPFCGLLHETTFTIRPSRLSGRKPIASAFHCIWLVCNGRRCRPGRGISLMYGCERDRWAHTFPF